MSDLKRLMSQAETTPALFERFSALEPEALLEWARAEGYNLSLPEAQQLSASCQTLSDDDLENVAGGWTGGGGDNGDGG